MAKANIELPLLEQTFDVSLTVGEAEFTISAFSVDQQDIIGVRTIENATRGWRMERIPWTDYRSITTQVSGAPLQWARHGNVVAVNPKPDVATTLKIDYRRRPNLGTLDDFDNEWHPIILALATSEGWKALLRPQLASAAIQGVPAFVQRSLANPLGQDDWETMWDDEHGIVPFDRDCTC